MRAIIQNLDQSIGQVAASSQELMANSAQNTAASEQIAGAVQQMAAGADDSKRQLDDNAVSLQAITGGIMRIAESSTDVSELSRETAFEAENGTTAVTETWPRCKRSTRRSRRSEKSFTRSPNVRTRLGISSTSSMASRRRRTCLL
ncbi:hypothetical protein [Exiguobacterium sp. s146]|uniref:hypothetical protein n=1 Tax=Exiguobacterium sp. s146 TaxID=2751223 RepID=UPI0033379973